jgi:hypothetical protein
MGFLAWAASHRVIAGRIASAVPDFALAGFFSNAWFTPTAFGSQVLARCEQIVLMEFIIVHSWAFLGFAMTAPNRRALEPCPWSGSESCTACSSVPSH